MTAATTLGNGALLARTRQARQFGEMLASQGLRQCDAALDKARSELRGIEVELAHGGFADDGAESQLLARRKQLKEQISALERQATSFIWHPLIIEPAPAAPAAAHSEPQRPGRVEIERVLPPVRDPVLPPLRESPYRYTSIEERRPLPARPWLTLGGIAFAGAMAWLAIGSGVLSSHHGAHVAVDVAGVQATKVAAQPVESVLSAAEHPETQLLRSELDALVAKADTIKTSNDIYGDPNIEAKLRDLRGIAETHGKTDPLAIAAFNTAVRRIGVMRFSWKGRPQTFSVPSSLRYPDQPAARLAPAIQEELRGLDAALRKFGERAYDDRPLDLMAHLASSYGDVSRTIDRFTWGLKTPPEHAELVQAFNEALTRAENARFTRTFSDGSTGRAAIENLPRQLK